jgi:hypothetical protein
LFLRFLGSVLYIIANKSRGIIKGIILNTQEREEQKKRRRREFTVSLLSRF